jgi:hypothetical protein
MLKLVKRWFVAEKAQLVGIIQGSFPLETAHAMERIIRQYGFRGNLRRMQNGQYGEFLLEGPKSKLEDFLKKLPTMPEMRGKTLRIYWDEPKGRYAGFRLSLEG